MRTLLLLALALPLAAADGKLSIIAFGAHPDDCDGRAAGRPRSGRRSATT